MVGVKAPLSVEREQDIQLLPEGTKRLIRLSVTEKVSVEARHWLTLSYDLSGSIVMHKPLQREINTAIDASV